MVFPDDLTTLLTVLHLHRCRTAARCSIWQVQDTTKFIIMLISHCRCPSGTRRIEICCSRGWRSRADASPLSRCSKQHIGARKSGECSEQKYAQRAIYLLNSAWYIAQNVVHVMLRKAQTHSICTRGVTAAITRSRAATREDMKRCRKRLHMCHANYSSPPRSSHLSGLCDH
jgi:hypothetical protein